MLSYPLASFELQRYLQNEPKFNGIYWRNNLLKRKDKADTINLNNYSISKQ